MAPAGRLRGRRRDRRRPHRAGRKQRRARRAGDDASGRIVTPGFVDIHTHLDAQLAWDPIASSCWHGVTSVVIGNCGVTFAPVKPGDHAWLAEMMESVEDIPARSILDGLPWDWESYAEFLGWLERTPKGVNVGGLVGHSATRYYAMGERSLDPEVTPTASELARIHALVGEALAAGAHGFSSSRTLRHKVPDARYVPGTFAQRDELLAVAEALRRHGRGVFEVAPRFDGEGPSEPRVESELAWMREASLRSERPLTFNLSQTRGQGEHWWLAIARAKEASAVGAQLRPQTSSRFIGVLTGIAHRTPFDAHPGWRRLRELPLAARLTALSDPRRRDSLIAEAKGDRAGLEASYVLNGPGGAARYLVPARARAGRDRGAAGRLAGRGLHRPRARNRGTSAALALEDAVRRLSADSARTFGIEGRGVLREGTFADVNVIDFEALALPVPEYVHDFPHGAGRFRQGASGYEATIVNGQVFMQRGQHTGALAGRLLRS